MKQGEDAAQRDLSAESVRVLSLLAKLPEATVRQAIDGISNWLSAWEKQVVGLSEGFSVWLKLWPIAVEATNAKQPDEGEVNLNTVAQTSDDREPMETCRRREFSKKTSTRPCRMMSPRSSHPCSARFRSTPVISRSMCPVSPQSCAAGDHSAITSCACGMLDRRARSARRSCRSFACCSQSHWIVNPESL